MDGRGGALLPVLGFCDALGIYPELGNDVKVVSRSLDRQLLGWDDALALVRFLKSSQRHDRRRARLSSPDQIALLDNLQSVAGRDPLFAKHTEAIRQILLQLASGSSLDKALATVSAAARRLMYEQGFLVDRVLADRAHASVIPHARTGEPQLVAEPFESRATAFSSAIREVVSNGGSVALIVSSDVLASSYEQKLVNEHHVPVIRWPRRSSKHLSEHRCSTVWLSTRQFSSLLLPEVSLIALDLGIPGEWPFFWQRFSLRSLVVIACEIGRARGIGCLVGTTVPTLSVLDACGWSAGASLQPSSIDSTAPSGPTFFVRTSAASDKQTSGASGILLKPTMALLRRTYDMARSSMLVLNIRGLATSIECAECGYTATCPVCGATLTLSANRTRLYCKQCGYSEAPPDTCPNCHGVQLRSRGYGLDRLAQELQRTFPVGSIEMMKATDEDAPVAEGKPCLYLGTYADVQRIAVMKPDLVVFPDVSVGLRHPVFDNVEQLRAVVQGAVSETAPGTVIVQLDRRSIGLRPILDGRESVSAFLERESNQRKELLMPPYARQFVIRVPWHGLPSDVQAICLSLADALRAEGVNALGLHGNVLTTSPRTKVLSVEFRADAAQTALELRVSASLTHSKVFQNAAIRVY
ncbi:MAG: hypothetical protein ABFD13_05085 [Candidatus Cryosericum sp.]